MEVSEASRELRESKKLSLPEDIASLESCRNLVVCIFKEQIATVFFGYEECEEICVNATR